MIEHAKCRQHRATVRDIFLHEGLERLRNSMNFMRWRKFEAVGKFFVYRDSLRIRIFLLPIGGEAILLPE